MLKKIIIGVLFIFTGYLSPATGHPTHVSLTTLYYNVETNSIEITMKLSTDDLEKALKLSNHEDLKLGSKNENPIADSLIYNYIIKKNTLVFDSSNIYIGWVGKEVEYDIIWCYLEITNVTPFNWVTIENRVLFELFENQLNIVNFIIDGDVKSLMLHHGKPMGRLKFNKW